MDYKNHQIEVSVRFVSDGSGWMPEVFVTYSETGKNVLKSLRMDQTFATPDEMTGSRLNNRRRNQYNYSRNV